MLSHEVFNVVERIALASGKQKESIIRDHAMDLAWYLQAAYDPYKTYGVKKVPKANRHIDQPFINGDMGDLLQRLETRELSGNAAQNAIKVALESVDSKSAELLARIIKKDLRAGISAKTINRAIPGLVPEFGCQLAQKFDPGRVRFPVAVQPKLDGVRVLADVDTIVGRVRFFSRTGKEFTNFEHLIAPCLNAGRQLNASRLMLDGEIVSGSFLNTVSEVRRKDEQAEDAILYVFDIVSSYFSPMPYKARRHILKRIEHFNSSVIVLEQAIVNSHDEILSYYRKCRDLGLEGAIVKDIDAPYEAKRSYGWMKIKDQQSVDVAIVDIEEGTGKYEGMLGALVVDVDGVRVNVGTGLSDDQRREFMQAHQDGELVGRLIEVEYHEKLESGSLRHPRFKGFRDYLATGEKV